MIRLARLRRTIEFQGYSGLSDRLLVAFDPWLRVTPAFCAGWTMVATAMGSARGLALLATACLIAVLSPVHPFDLAYNLVIRHWVQGTALPRTPPPRRFASFVAAAWLAAAALAYAMGAPRVGVALGLSFTAMALTPVVSGLCIASWAWTRFWRSASAAEIPGDTRSACPPETQTVRITPGAGRRSRW
jgi:Domain of unknown function (DUF4395)